MISAPSALTRRRFAAGAVLAGSFARSARAEAPVRIGVLTERGGPYAEDSGRGSVVSAQLAIDDFRRGNPGIAVELVSADAQTKPDVASAIAGAWFDRDGVDVIIDVPVSNCALAVATAARARNKMAIFNTSTSALTGASCSPNHIQWAFDTHALSASMARALMAEGGDTWFLIQADYTFGAVIAAEATAVIQAGGGRVVGSVKHPFPGTADFSSYLLQAQASGAKVVGLANAGADAANCIKQGSPHRLLKTDAVDGSCSASCAKLVAVECNELEGAAHHGDYHDRFGHCQACIPGARGRCDG